METMKDKDLFSEVIDCITNKRQHNVTFANTGEFIYTWEIKNFRQTLERITEIKIISPNFKIYVDENMSSSIYLTSDTDNLSLYFSHGNYPEDQTFFKVSLIDKDKKENKVQTFTYDSSSSGYKLPVFENFVKKDFLLDEANGLLPNGNLIIHCIIYPNLKYTHIEDLNKFINENQSNYFLKENENFEDFLETGKFSDMQLVIDEKKFDVHKIILAMRSPVFSAMFEHDMKENNENLVEITDIKYDVMKEVLRFIYAGKINDFETLGKDILMAADKYEINQLKNLCEKEFIISLNIENVADILVVAHRFSADNLKICALKFLSFNSNDVNKNELLKKIMDFMSESLVSESLVSETFEALTLNK